MALQGMRRRSPPTLWLRTPLDGSVLGLAVRMALAQLYCKILYKYTVLDQRFIRLDIVDDIIRSLEFAEMCPT
jgi:hypothetical protein